MNAAAPTIDIFYGRDIENVTERRFLRRLVECLTVAGLEAVIFANVVIGPQKRQIDFVVATATMAAVVEVKGYVHAVHGAENGPWRLDSGDGEPRALGRTNPYHQALDCRYAVSDALAAHAGLSSDDAKAAILGDLCLFPTAPLGSSVPASDHKLTIGGFPDLEALFARRLRNPLALATWKTFAEALGLSSGLRGEPGPETALVDGYVSAFLNLRRAIDGPYVEPLIAGDDATTATLAKRLVEGAQLHLVGGSGSGKSELLAALATATARAGFAPIIVQARAFEGDLAPLLRRAVASATTATPGALIAALNKVGREALLFIDGLNECQPTRRGDLIAALQALRLRWDVRITTTAQAPLTMPATLSGETVEVLQPDLNQARLLVEAHLGRNLAAAEVPALEVVATAHDASILATVLQTQSDTDGRYALYAAFTRERAKGALIPAVHQALGELAAQMRETFVSALPRPAVERSMEIAGSMGRAAAAALQAGLLKDDGAAVGFRHDLLGDFYAADHVLRASSSREALSAAAARPINAELREFMLGGCPTTAEIEALLTATPTANLLAAGLQGRCGAKVRALILDRCRDVIEELRLRFAHLSLELPPEFDHTQRINSLRLSFGDQPGLDETDRAYFAVLPYTLAEGLLPDLLALYGDVDVRIAAEVARMRAAHPHIGRNWWTTAGYGAVYGITFGPEGHELEKILEGMQMIGLPGGRRATDRGLWRLLDDFEAYSPGQLFLLISAYRGAHDEPPPTRFNALLRHVWGLGIYHLRLLVSSVVRFRGRQLEEDERQAVRASLESWLSDNAWFNSIIIDALEGVGGLDAEIDVDSALAEYDELLALPDSPEVRKLALGTVIHTYDHPFSDIYWSAFYDHLAVEKRQAILMRAIEDETGDAMFLADAVRALIDVPTHDAAPRLNAFAQRPWPQNHSSQDAVRLYSHSIAALAKMGVPLTVDGPDDLVPAERAWRCAGRLVHAFNTAEPASDAEIERLWGALAACGPAAVIDALMHLEMDRSPYERRAKLAFVDRCASGLLAICRDVLDPGYVGASIFDRFPQPKERDAKHVAFAMSVMGKVGRRSDLPRLRRWLDDPQQGEIALAAAREIEER